MKPLLYIYYACASLAAIAPQRADAARDATFSTTERPAATAEETTATIEKTIATAEKTIATAENSAATAENPVAACVNATFDQRLGGQHYAIDAAEVGTVALDVDALAFFKDNEFDGDVVRGYSLPGFRLTPRVSYVPLPQVRLEAGCYAMVYDGAGKYPCYVYHDVATWKGNQHQHGAHALPFFRATMSLGSQRRSHTTVVLGDIYGGATHGLLQPIYNPELNVTDDPEMGTQVIVDRRHWHSDVWINWQSYIFEEDTHQEAFTVGWTQRISLPRGVSVPVQIIVQHRGGEQDLPELNLGVQTIANGAAGINYEWRRTPPSVDGSPQRSRGLSGVSCEALALAALQQSGHLWPFDSGAAMWASAALDWAFGLRVKAGVFCAPRNFCSLYGSPFFGTVSVKRPGLVYDGTTAGYWCVDYARTFSLGRTHEGRHSGSYTIGARADGYVSHGREPFSFGVYLRACPSFVLKRWR